MFEGSGVLDFCFGGVLWIRYWYFDFGIGVCVFGLFMLVWMMLFSVKLFGVFLVCSLVYSLGVSILVMWLLWLLRLGNLFLVGKCSFSVLWLLEKGMVVVGCGEMWGLVGIWCIGFFRDL